MFLKANLDKLKKEGKSGSKMGVKRKKMAKKADKKAKNVPNKKIKKIKKGQYSLILEGIQEGESLDKIVKEFGITRKTWYRWRKANPEIQAEYEKAQKKGYAERKNILEDQLYQIAIGEIVADKVRFNALKFMLMRLAPEYRTIAPANTTFSPQEYLTLMTAIHNKDVETIERFKCSNQS